MKSELTFEAKSEEYSYHFINNLLNQNLYGHQRKTNCRNFFQIFLSVYSFNSSFWISCKATFCRRYRCHHSCIGTESNLSTCSK